MPAKVTEMLVAPAQLRGTAFHVPADMSQTAICHTQVATNGNFYGPFLSGRGPAPPPPPPAPGCGAELQRGGCLPGPKLKCLACTVLHKAELSKVGCQQGDIKALCGG